MYEIISLQNPGMFAIPSTYEIQCYNNQVLQVNKSTIEEEGVSVTGNTTANDNYIMLWLNERLGGDRKAKNSILYIEMVNQFPGLKDRQTEAQVKKKISSTKAGLKNTAWKSLLVFQSTFLILTLLQSQKITAKTVTFYNEQ